MSTTLNVQELANTVRRNYLLSQITSGVRVLTLVLLVGGVVYHEGLSYYQDQQVSKLEAFVLSQSQQSVAQAGLDVEY